MGIIGFGISICSQMSINRSLTLLNACNQTGIKLIDKAIIPIGTFCVSSMIGDMAGDYAERKVKEIKEEAKNLSKKYSIGKDGKIVINEPKPVKVQNVFDTYGDNEENEGVNENGNS